MMIVQHVPYKHTMLLREWRRSKENKEKIKLKLNQHHGRRFCFEVHEPLVAHLFFSHSLSLSLPSHFPLLITTRHFMKKTGGLSFQQRVCGIWWRWKNQTTSVYAVRRVKRTWYLSRKNYCFHSRGIAVLV